MRMSTLAVWPTCLAAARMFSRSNSLSMLISTLCSTASCSSQGCLPLPLKMVLPAHEVCSAAQAMLLEQYKTLKPTQLYVAVTYVRPQNCQGKMLAGTTALT